MTIKERENQLRIRFNLYIWFCLVFWLGAVVYIGLTLWRLRKVPTLPTTAISVNVPSLNEERFRSLRASTKPDRPTAMNLPVVRAEPFD